MDQYHEEKNEKRKLLCSYLKLRNPIIATHFVVFMQQRAKEAANRIEDISITHLQALLETEKEKNILKFLTGRFATFKGSERRQFQMDHLKLRDSFDVYYRFFNLDELLDYYVEQYGKAVENLDLSLYVSIEQEKRTKVNALTQEINQLFAAYLAKNQNQLFAFLDERMISHFSEFDFKSYKWQSNLGSSMYTKKDFTVTDDFFSFQYRPGGTIKDLLVVRLENHFKKILFKQNTIVNTDERNRELKKLHDLNYKKIIKSFVRSKRGTFIELAKSYIASQSGKPFETYIDHLFEQYPVYQAQYNSLRLRTLFLYNKTM